MNPEKTFSPARLRRPWLTVVFLGLMAAACGSGNDGSDLQPPPERPDVGVMGDGGLKTILDYVVADSGIPAVTAMFAHEGVVLEQAASGRRSSAQPDEVTEYDKWHIGSLTKSMTSTLAAVLIEQGNLSWDTTIGDVFPEFAGQIGTVYTNVRLDELLSHTGGIPTGSSDLADAISGQGGDLVSQRYQFTRQILIEAPAGSRGDFAYSNAGYIVAGAMLERVGGMSWEALMQQFVFDPLGMADSGFGAPGLPGQNDHPSGHIPDGSNWYALAAGSPDADNPALFGPAGTVHASMNDIMNYMTAHLGGALGNDVPGLLTAQSFARLHDAAPGTAYSMGWDVTPAGLTHIGSNDRWFARIIIVPELAITVFIAVNAGDPYSPDGGIPMQAIVETGEYLQQRFQAAFGTG